MEKIKQEVESYRKDNVYNMDNLLILKYYPERIVNIVNEENANCSLKDLSLLELGLGHGYTQEIFERYFGSYTVLEGDEAIIESFQKGHPESNIQIINTFFENWGGKEEEEKYDIIVAGFVLEHVDEPQEIIKKYKKFLKQDGKMFISVPNAEALNRRIGYEANLLKEMKELSENDIKLGHKRYYTVKEIKKECQNAGLKVQRIEGIFLKPLTTRQLLSLNLEQKIMEAFCTVGKEYPELCLGILLECEKE